MSGTFLASQIQTVYRWNGGKIFINPIPWALNPLDPAESVLVDLKIKISGCFTFKLNIPRLKSTYLTMWRLDEL